MRSQNTLLVACCMGSILVACSSDAPPANGEAGLDASANVDGAADAGNVDAPTGPCASDAVTGDSLEAARVALAKGATSVSLSPKGCLRYERVVQGNVIASEKFLEDGVTVLTFSRSAQSTTASGDFDRDGFAEWSYVATHGASALADKAELTTSSAKTKAPIARKTYTWTDANTIHVVVGKDDGKGGLAKAREFNTPRLQADTSRAAEDLGAPVSSRLSRSTFKVTTSGCSPADAALIEQRLGEAMDGDPADKKSGGLLCLTRLGQRAKLMRLLEAYLRDVEITCVDDPSIGAVYDGVGWFNPFAGSDLPPVSFRVNPANFGHRTEANQRHILFHEMLHELGEHDPEILKAKRVLEIDPTEACAETCWPNTLTTKCSCATCLGTNICDPRCAGFRDCNPDMGAQCPCPTRGTYYATCSECLAECPSGLACFGFSTCKPFNVDCGTTTCP